MDAQLGLFPDLVESAPPERVGPARPAAEAASLAASLPRGLRLGTSSWSFPGWAGIVYAAPATEADLARHGLAAYARHPLLRTVCIDRSYYRPVEERTFARWASEVPEDFRFVVKADRRLVEPEGPGGEPSPGFLDPALAADDVVGPALAGLGPKLGPILFQLPPRPAAAFGGPGRFARRLRAFLDALPPGPAYAVELRTPGLLGPAYAEALDAAGASHAYAVHPAAPTLDAQTSLIPPHRQPLLLVRWMLRRALGYEEAKRRYAPFDRLVDEDPATREEIVRMALDALVAERDAFVIANNKAEGSSPLTLFRLAGRIAAPFDAP